MRVKKPFIDLIKINEEMSHDIKHVISKAESSYRAQLFTLVHKIYNKKQCKVVLMAGPSCAGKTTTAVLLKEIFERMGKKVQIVSMDDFFISREDTPFLPNGQRDYDNVTTVNLQQLKDCFSELFETGKAKFPHFDFQSGQSHAGVFDMTFDDNSMIIFEGLHVLNPLLIKAIGTKKYFKIYINALSGFKYKQDAIHYRDVRLIRRVVRDVERRNTTLEKSLESWPTVCAAEDKYITPYAKTANFVVNTTHSYELGLYKKDVFEILLQDRDIDDVFPFGNMLIAAKAFNKSIIPTTSLMWEFIDTD